MGAMFQVRIHGRGGQGVVSAAEMLSVAAFEEGRHAQAFPSFGSERMGAPVAAYCRIADSEIRTREPVMEPDIVVVQDPTLLHQVDVFSGLARRGYVLVNSGRSLHALGLDDLVARVPAGHACSLPATEIALAHVGRPLPNAALLGAVAAMTGCLALDSVAAAIQHKFPGATGAANAAAARAAYEVARSALHTEDTRA